MVRMSAEERRESVVRAALQEFARGGYNGTSTDAIAKRVGVSQPYLFRLFPDKKAIFLAAVERCIAEMKGLFEKAAEGLEGEEAQHAMARAYTEAVVEEPQWLLMQMHAFAAVATAEESGDHEFGAVVRANWEDLWDTVHIPLGAEIDETTAFMAYGMLINCLLAMGFPPEHRLWEGLNASARATRPFGN
ncbi:TetR/AcrR family transcriptional regulator [Streptomyces sp. NPDC050560]|uniref:TetR/AcrR family transcriptional regulator n=1 Tax=Streptomyces sp. NPDC050560 TaxID=3365630 RepID=UPI0037B450CD